MALVHRSILKRVRRLLDLHVSGTRLVASVTGEGCTDGGARQSVVVSDRRTFGGIRHRELARMVALGANELKNDVRFDCACRGGLILFHNRLTNNPPQVK